MKNLTLQELDFLSMESCCAYESGFGHGLNKDTEYNNPWAKETVGFLSYKRGFDLGRERQQESGKPNLFTKIVEENKVLQEENSKLKEKIEELRELYLSELWSDRSN